MAQLTAEAYLAALEEARQRLVLGEQAQTVGYDGQSVTYKPTDLPTVQAEIARIKRELGLTTGRQALRAYF